MKIHFVSGISGDKVEITDKNGIKETYAYGWNASWNVTFADEKKPYIGNIIRRYAENEGVSLSDIEVTGFYVFPNREATQKEIDDFKAKYLTEGRIVRAFE